MPEKRVGKRSGPEGDSWYYRIDLGRDAAGKRVQKFRRGFASEEAALAAMQDELVDRRRGAFIEPSRQTLTSYMDQWLTTSSSRWRSSTRASNRICAGRVTTHLGTVPIGGLTPLMIQSTYTILLKMLAPGTVRLTHITLNQALKQAVKWRLIPFNPAEDVDLPALPPQTIARWTADEAKRFLTSSVGDPSHELWRLLLDTGMRIGEAQALRWSDLDLEVMSVSIQRTVTRSEDDREVIGDYPKTASSRRVVPLSRTTTQALTATRREQLLRRIKLGPLWQDLDLVFDAGDGRLSRRKTLADRLTASAKRAKVLPLTPHGLRHTNATLLSSAGISAKVISERLGHKTVNITLNRYVHPDDAAHRHAADVLANMLG